MSVGPQAAIMVKLWILRLYVGKYVLYSPFLFDSTKREEDIAEEEECFGFSRGQHGGTKGERAGRHSERQQCDGLRLRFRKEKYFCSRQN